MKIRAVVFGLLSAVVIYLLKRQLDMEERLVITEAELRRLQRQEAALRESYEESSQRHREFEDENPQPNDPDRKWRKAMMDAILSSEAREELGDNYIDSEDDEDDE